MPNASANEKICSLGATIFPRGTLPLMSGAVLTTSMLAHVAGYPATLTYSTATVVSASAGEYITAFRHRGRG